jgi:hypothetical protein
LPWGALTAQPNDTTEDGIPTTQARNSPSFIVYLENDYFGGTDRHYTNGFKMAWLTGDLTDWGKRGWRQSFLEALPFVNHPGSQKNLGLAVGQQIFTPQDISATNPDPNDRPYAGWSYLEFSFLAKTEHVADTIAIQVGMVGPHSYADDIQTWAHHLTDNEIPRGWDYQLEDEVGLNIAWERKWRGYTRTFARINRADWRAGETIASVRSRQPHWGMDFMPHIGVVLGNVHTYANLGATVRAGYNLPSDFGVSMMRPAGLASSPIDDADPRVNESGWSLFAFAGVDARAVARNIFLDGNTFKDSRSVEKKPYVTDLSYGFGVVKDSFQMTFTRVVRSREFETLPQNNSDFGSVTLSWTF